MHSDKPPSGRVLYVLVALFIYEREVQVGFLSSLSSEEISLLIFFQSM